MVGGDFNTEQNRGWRGDRLEELLCETDLDICNKTSLLAFEDSWTFRSALGTKRVLEHCLVSTGIQVKSSKAIKDLVLRSDHRAVQTYLVLPPEIRPAPKRRMRKRRIDWGKFEEIAKDHNCDPNGGLQQFEKELGELVHMCADTSNESPTRPWDCAELQNFAEDC